MLHYLNYLDAMILAIMVIFFMIGFRRGFARTLAGTLGAFLAIIGGFLGRSLLTPKLAECFRIFLFQNLSSRFSGSAETINQLAKTVVDTMQGSILRTVVFTMSYFFTVALWLYACNYSKLLSKFKPLPDFNQFLGGVMGMCKGFLILCVVFVELHRFGVLPSFVIESSFFARKVALLLRALVG
ncbi:MAG: CvpA family protein [Oscillospiraceae bacterium]|nr:CvpA family protein [Oscillospiraceae bacterium]